MKGTIDEVVEEFRKSGAGSSSAEAPPEDDAKDEGGEE